MSTEALKYQPTFFEKAVNALPLSVRSPFIIAVSFMCVGDGIVHPNLGDSVPRNRRLLKKFFENFMRGRDARDIVSHIGNTFLSVAPAIAIVLVGEACRFYGEKYENEKLLKVARWAPIAALGTVLALNIGEEATQMQIDFDESVGDFFYGFGAGTMATSAAAGAPIQSLFHKIDSWFSIPTSAEDIFRLKGIATDVNEIFPD